jgi:4-amino-4-deoxy-L-arabinose transferase-like glycosyltransferase
MTVQIPTVTSPITIARAVVDDVSIRLIATSVLVIVALIAATRQWWLFGFLAVDFALRAAGQRRYSPLGVLVQHVARPRVRISPRPTSAAPKRFAAGIGAVLTGTAAVLWLIGLARGQDYSPVVWGITAAMIAFPTLEAALGLCVGCKVYALLIRIGLLPNDACIDCAPVGRTEEKK